VLIIQIFKMAAALQIKNNGDAYNFVIYENFYVFINAEVVI
jgi:hypothetical protein